MNVDAFLDTNILLYTVDNPPGLAPPTVVARERLAGSP